MNIQLARNNPHVNRVPCIARRFYDLRYDHRVETYSIYIYAGKITQFV